MDETGPKHGDRTPAGEKLDWSAFLDRFFPHRRRHDFAAIAAYTAYMDGLELPAEGGPASG
jgi:hypothetical protein